MELRAVVTRGLAVGVARIVLLTLAAVGFVAMHGVAATDPGGAHHDPMSVSVTVEHPGPSAVDHGTAATTPVAAAPGGHEQHGLMAACMFVLLSVLAGITLHARYRGTGPDPSRRPRSVADGDRRSRAPPAPIFLSLCVFRL